MQVEPQPQQIVVSTPEGVELPLEPGRQVVARVVAVDPSGGGARISLAGQTIAVRTDLALHPGDIIQLTVARAEGGQVTLTPSATTVAPETLPGSPTTAPAARLPGASALLEQIAPRAIESLAREGVAVTPQIARLVSEAVEQTIATVPPGRAVPSVETLARSAATLVARGIAPNPALTLRVAAAFEHAGGLAPALAQVRTDAPQLAALTRTEPQPSALRAAVTPALTPSELAVTRIAQALSQPTAPVQQSTPPQLTVATTATGVQVSATASAAPETVQAVSAQVRGDANVAPGAIRGDASVQAQQQSPSSSRPVATPTTGEPTPPLVATSAPAPAGSAAPATASGDARAATLASAQAAAQSTPPAVARVVAELSVALARFVTALAPETTPALSTPLRSAETQTQPPAGSFTPQAAGGGASGQPAPLVTALQQTFLGSRGFERQLQEPRPGGSQMQQLAQLLRSTDPQQLNVALQRLTTLQTLQLAGTMLDGLPPGTVAALPGPIATELRNLVNTSLHDLGTALRQMDGDEALPLRIALDHLASHDPRPAVADHARALTDAADGAQVLSTPKHGQDPGYAYFQMPLPNGTSAEVMVRRDPGRRRIGFDRFDIAFLLDTESLGTLMVHLDAHPGGVSAVVRTDRPDVEPLLREQAHALEEPIAREAQRPVTVNVGIFDQPPPDSLLEPDLGPVPGVNAYYA